MKLSTKYIRPGMKLMRPVFGPNGELLLQRGVVLTAQYIMSLRQRGVLTVDVEGPKEIDEEYREVLEDEVRQDVMNTVREWTFNSRQTSVQRVIKKVEMIVDEILNGKGVVGNLTEICSVDMYTYAHSVDVCVLSLTMGIQMGYKREALMRLGVGSILHDLGKSRVPPEILNKPGKLTPVEFAEMKKHPLYGYKIILESGDEIDPESASVILNHHEKYDGNGYPRGLKGDKIDEKSVICAVADVYNAITTDRVYREALPPHEAYEMIMAAGNVMFDCKVLDAFLKCIVPYPVGTFVALSNGFRGVVSRLNKKLPLRPVVKLLNSREEIDLMRERNLVISGLIRPEEIFELAKGGVLGATTSTPRGVVRNS